MEISEQGKAQSAEADARTPRAEAGLFPFGPMASRFWVYATSIVFPTIALIVIFIYCRSVSDNVLASFGPSVMVAWAALAVGAFLGFLFGIPRALPVGSTLTGEVSNADGRLLTNTNLEQVSDWITKIIVGVTLVEFGNLLPALGRLVEVVATIYGGNAPGAVVMAAAILTLFSILGFFDGYIGARSLLTVMFESIRRGDREGNPPQRG